MKNYKDYLFGTRDRIYTFISIIISILSIGLTFYTYKYPENTSYIIIIRDVLVVCVLLSTTILLIFKYMQREQYLVAAKENLEKSNSRLSKQFNNFHNIIHKYRCDVFLNYIDYINEDIFIDNKNIQAFKKIQHSITSDLRELYCDFLLSKGIDIKDDISVAVKLISSKDALISSFKNSRTITEQQLKILQDSKSNKFVITSYRDPKTFESKRESREVNTNFYSITANTAFDHIYTHKNSFYASDNLCSLGVTYKNENTYWKSCYNSTIVAPIRFNNAKQDKVFCFGFITIDSINKEKMKLFEYEESIHIIGHCADLMAIFFLTVALDQEIHDISRNT